MLMTDKEKKVFDCLKTHLTDYEDNFSDLDADFLSSETNIPLKIIRGVISSLVKKDLIYSEEIDVNGIPNVFYYMENTGKAISNKPIECASITLIDWSNMSITERLSICQGCWFKCEYHRSLKLQETKLNGVR